MNHCPLSRALFLRVHLHFHFMSDYTNYAQFNAWTFTGRVLATKVLDGAEGEYMAVTMITTLLKDGPEVTIEFYNSNGLLGLQKKGWLPAGRQLTVTGHISGVTQTYEKDGQICLKKRPEIKLQGATVLEGGLGPMPKEKMPSTAGQVVVQQPYVEKAPTLEEQPF